MTGPRHATVTNDRQLRAAATALARQCKIMSSILKRTGLPAPRHFPADFSGLAKIVVGRQLSTHSAAAIWARVEQALSPVAAETILSTDDAGLKSLGLSNGKVRTLRALSRAVIDDGLDFGILNVADDRTIVERLTAVHGIGPWTADIYILFALARKDAFASGDLAPKIGPASFQTRSTADYIGPSEHRRAIA